MDTPLPDIVYLKKPTKTATVTTPGNIVDTLRSSDAGIMHRVYELAYRDLPKGAGNPACSTWCVGMSAERFEMPMTNRRLHIICDGPIDDPTRRILLRLGDSLLAIDQDSLKLNLLTAASLLVLFVHSAGWTSVLFDITFEDKQTLLGAILGMPPDLKANSIASSIPIEALDIRLGFHSDSMP
jgi:hypothetical protein